MFVSRVSTSLLFDRINAESNSPEMLTAEKIIKGSLLTVRPLGELVVAPINNSIRNVSEQYGVEDADVPLFRPADMRGLFLDTAGALRVTRVFEQNHRKARVHPGDIVISAAGTVASVARVPSNIEFGCINGSFARVVVKKECEGFVLSYLASRYGFQAMMRWAVGSVQKHLNLEDLPNVKIAVPNLAVQKYIGDKVHQAERLRAYASKSIDFALASIEQLIELAATESDIENRVLSGSNNTPKKRLHIDYVRHNRTPSSSIVSRIDAWHYQPHLTTAYEQIEKSGRCCLLHEIIDPQRDIKGGATPLGADYSQSGKIRFYRTSDVFGMSVRQSGTAYITEHQDSELSRSRLQAGDVLLTITGADFGHAGVITHQHLPGNISQHSVRFRPTVDADYLVAYLESSYGQQMLWRQAYGATRPAIDYPGVRSLLIRVPGPSVQKVIGDSVRAGINSREFSIGLVVAAKSLVEALIERKVTEDELIQAQSRLEQGDDLADRAVLHRLFEGGWDATETRPLFPDLNAYYETLRLVERVQTEVAAK